MLPRKQLIFLLLAIQAFLGGLYMWTQTHPNFFSEKERFSRQNQRIVSLLPAYLDILSAYGAADQVVGVTEGLSPIDPKWNFISRIGSSKEPKLQAVLAQNPSLVLGAPPSWVSHFDPSTVAVINGIPIIHNRLELYHFYRSIGLYIGKSEEAISTLLRQIEAEWMLAKQQIAASAKTTPTVLVVFPGMHNDFYVLGSDSLENEIIEAAHAENVIKGLSPQDSFSAEQIIKLRPDWILTDETHISTLANHPLLQELSAVKQHQILGFHASEVMSPSRVLVVGELARHFHGFVVSLSSAFSSSM